MAEKGSPPPGANSSFAFAQRHVPPRNLQKLAVMTSYERSQQSANQWHEQQNTILEQLQGTGGGDDLPPDPPPYSPLPPGIQQPGIHSHFIGVPHVDILNILSEREKHNSYHSCHSCGSYHSYGSQNTDEKKLADLLDPNTPPGSAGIGVTNPPVYRIPSAPPESELEGDCGLGKRCSFHGDVRRSGRFDGDLERDYSCNGSTQVGVPLIQTNSKEAKVEKDPDDLEGRTCGWCWRPRNLMFLVFLILVIAASIIAYVSWKASRG